MWRGRPRPRRRQPSDHVFSRRLPNFSLLLREVGNHRVQSNRVFTTASTSRLNSFMRVESG